MPTLDEAESRRLVAGAPVARLGTHGPQGRIDLVPVTFAVLDDGRLVTAVDHKPKTTTRLRRLSNIARDPLVAVLVDHWDDDWSALWWVRIHGTATVVEPEATGHAELVRALQRRYRQYEDHPPAGPAVVIEPTLWTGWSAQ